MPKSTSDGVGARSSCSTHSARSPNHVGDPQRAHRQRFCEVLAGYHPTATMRDPSTPFTRAPSASCVTGWVSAPRTASRRVRARTGSICVRVVLRRGGLCRAPESFGTPRSPGTCPLCMPSGGGKSARRVATAHVHDDPTSRMESPREALTASLHAPRGAPRGRTKTHQPPGTYGMSARCEPRVGGPLVRPVAVAHAQGDSASGKARPRTTRP